MGSNLGGGYSVNNSNTSYSGGGFGPGFGGSNSAGTSSSNLSQYEGPYSVNNSNINYSGGGFGPNFSDIGDPKHFYVPPMPVFKPKPRPKPTFKPRVPQWRGSDVIPRGPYAGSHASPRSPMLPPGTYHFEPMPQWGMPGTSPYTKTHDHMPNPYPDTHFPMAPAHITPHQLMRFVAPPSRPRPTVARYAAQRSVKAGRIR